MQEHHDDHPLGSPSVHVTDNSSPGHHIHNILNRLVSRLHRRCIIDHQDDAGK